MHASHLPSFLSSTHTSCLYHLSVIYFTSIKHRCIFDSQEDTQKDRVFSSTSSPPHSEPLTLIFSPLHSSYLFYTPQLYSILLFSILYSSFLSYTPLSLLHSSLPSNEVTSSSSSMRDLSRSTMMEALSSGTRVAKVPK